MCDRGAACRENSAFLVRSTRFRVYTPLIRNNQREGRSGTSAHTSGANQRGGKRGEKRSSHHPDEVTIQGGRERRPERRERRGDDLGGRRDEKRRWKRLRHQEKTGGERDMHAERVFGGVHISARAVR